MLFAPCLPPGWQRAAMKRPWRGATLDVTIERDMALAAGEVKVTVDGRPLAGGLLEAAPNAGQNQVLVRFG
jgi:cellobiose phosphorylase